MGLLETSLAAAAALAATACYVPDLRDCTLTCNSAADCAAGQVCGGDHFCAAPELAGTCSAVPTDAGTPPRDGDIGDASMPDAPPDAPPDAATEAVLSVAIAGKGRIDMLGTGTCNSEGPDDGSCQFVVPRGALVTAQATASPGWRFDRWTSDTCGSLLIPTCTFVAAGPTVIAVKFRKEHD